MKTKALIRLRRVLNINVATLALFFGSIVSAQLLTMAVTDAGPNTSTYPLTSGYGGGKYITTAPDGSMWYAEGDSSGNYAFGHITTTGATTDYSATPSGYTGVTSVGGLAVDSSGNVWFSGCAYGGMYHSDLLMKLSPSTGAVTVTGNTGMSCSNDPVAIDSTGNIWVAANGGGYSSYLVRFTSSGAYSYSYSSPATYWNGAATGPGNTLWLTDGNNNALDKATLSSTTDNVTGFDAYTIPTASSSPRGITLGSDGNMWFTEEVGNIGKVTSSGTITEYATPSGSDPYAITTGPDSALWFADPGNNAIGRMTTTGSVAEYSVSGSDLITSITTGGDGAIWFADQGTPNFIGRLGY